MDSQRVGADPPDLTALRLLVAVADHGSLSAAARAIEMAQPNASRSLARLERTLALSLVVRSTSGSTLTSAGLLVVEWARAVLAATDRLLDGASALRAGAGTPLSVSASQTVAEHLLPAWLATLRMGPGSHSVSVQVHNSAEVVDDVRQGRCAVGFIEGPSAPAGLHQLVVARDELVLVVAPGHPWARRRRPVGPAELAGTSLVTRERGSGTRVALEAALNRALTAPARPRGSHAVAPASATPATPAAPATPAMAAPALEMASNAAVRVAAATGAAPAVLSALAVSDAVRAGTLRVVPLAELDLHRQLRAVWAGPRRLTGPAADLVTIARRAGAPG